MWSSFSCKGKELTLYPFSALDNVLLFLRGYKKMNQYVTDPPVKFNRILITETFPLTYGDN